MLRDRAGFAALAVAVSLGLAVPCAVAQDAGVLTPDQRRVFETHVISAPLLRSARFTISDASERPRNLSSGAFPSDFTWTADGVSRTLDDYLARHPVTALLVAHDGRLLVERYRHGAGANSLFLSNSIAKSFVGLGLLHAIEERRVKLDDRIDRFVPALAGRPVGATTIRDNLRMGTGLPYVESYTPDDDHARFGRTVRGPGVVAALAGVGEGHAVDPGTRFSYGGFSTAALAAVLERETGQSFAAYFADRVWRRIGSEAPLYWQVDRAHATLGYCCAFARARDYLRLAITLAEGGPAVPSTFVPQTTEPAALDPPFRPTTGRAGYANQFWVTTGPRATLMMVGVRGQHVFIDTARRLVFVQFAASEQRLAGHTSLLRDRSALWAALQLRFDRP